VIHHVYANPQLFVDITANTNPLGSFPTCSPASAMCSGTAGYDRPTGLGVPNGAALRSAAAAKIMQSVEAALW
jgi:hypothetical protein